MNKVLENDLTMKIISVLVAVVLWFQVTTETNPLTPRTFQNVPIKVVNAEDRMLVTGMMPNFVRVTAQSQKMIISKVNEDEVQATCDLKGMDKPGQSLIPISISLPKGLELVEVVPEQVTVSLDIEETKSIKPEIRVTGSPSEDFVVSTVEADPAEVELKGPRSSLQVVQKAIGTIDVSKAARDVTGPVELKAVDADGRAVKSVEISPTTVEARVIMKALPPAKYVQVRPAITGSVRPGFKIGEATCEPKTVKVRGPVSQASRLTYVQTAPVDVSNQLFNVVKQVEVIVPSGFTVEPKTVKVTVPVLEDKIEKTFPNIPIQIRGLSLSQFKFEVEPNSVSVTIEGRKDQFEDFDKQKIEAFIQASGLQEGKHELKVQVTLGGRDDLTVVRVSPEQTTLSLTARWR